MWSAPKRLVPPIATTVQSTDRCSRLPHWSDDWLQICRLGSRQWRPLINSPQHHDRAHYSRGQLGDTAEMERRTPPSSSSLWLGLVVGTCTDGSPATSIYLGEERRYSTSSNHSQNLKQRGHIRLYPMFLCTSLWAWWTFGPKEIKELTDDPLTFWCAFSY